SAPHEVVDKYELANFTLEYRMKHSVLKSLTSILGGGGGDANRGITDSDHVD
ncbi:hypothetical protein Tco_0749405, partial [Tanacetum coccineum]